MECSRSADSSMAAVSGAAQEDQVKVARAAYAMAAMNGHPFDAKHTFWVNRFTDVEKYVNMDETWVEPEPEPYKPKVCLLSSECMVNTDTCGRNIYEPGWAMHKAATNTPLSAERK